MLVYGGRSDIAGMVVGVSIVVRGVCRGGRGRGKVEEPGLEYDVLWGGVDAETRSLGCEVDEDLVGGQLWDGEEDLEFKGGRWCRGRDGAIDAQGVSKEVSLWGLEVELRVEVSTSHGEQVN